MTQKEKNEIIKIFENTRSNYLNAENDIVCVGEELFHALDIVIKELKNSPPVISTRKVGKWKQEYIGCMYDVCSECGQKVTKGFFKYNYCPNCGAKMKTKSESEGK
jgi:predicted RNA-binding Zn-ribbon protein involved in translation (DUF1610 family)